jgi:6-phosphofructokinase
MAEKNKKYRIGILVGGGSAPGINSVIHAVTMEAHRNHCTVTGIYDGFKHLMEGRLVGISLTPEIMEYKYLEGGSILHSARANPTKSPVSLHQCVIALQNDGIDVLVSIGGDDTAYSISEVTRHAREVMGFDLRSVHIPKTIDNDLPLPGDIPTFGYETAREIGVRLVTNLERDSSTMGHWFLVLSMGRHAGHLALGIGQGSTSAITLIPEEWVGREIRLQEIVDILVTTMLMRLSEGKPYGVAVLAEGILENLSQEDIMTQHIERDEYGHIRLPDVNFLDILKVEIDKELVRYGIHIKMVNHVLGYELRCAPPCAMDIEYTRSLGCAAVEFLLNGGTSAIITLQDGKTVPIPYQDMINQETGRIEVRMVDVNSYHYETAYKFMNRIKPEHIHDDLLLGKLAELTHLTIEQFNERYGYLMKDATSNLSKLPLSI